MLETSKAFTWELLAPVFPRLVQVALTMCQPLLLNRFIDYLAAPKESQNIGYGLIGAYGVVYLGLAVRFNFRPTNLE